MKNEKRDVKVEMTVYPSRKWTTSCTTRSTRCHTSTTDLSRSCVQQGKRDRPNALCVRSMRGLARIRKRDGRCYELALKAMLLEPEADRWTLVHGRVWRGIPGELIDHAWIELDDGRVYDPVKNTYMPGRQYRLMRKVVEVRRYTKQEAMALCAEAKHYGPWQK